MDIFKVYLPLSPHDCRIISGNKIAKIQTGKMWHLLTHRRWRVPLMSSYSTGVITSICIANWGYGQGVAAGWVWVSQRLWVPVPDVGGVVTQTAGGDTGQWHLIALWHCLWTHCYLKIWEQKKWSMIAKQHTYVNVYHEQDTLKLGFHTNKMLFHINSNFCFTCQRQGPQILRISPLGH